MEQFLHEKLREDRLWTTPLLQTAPQEGCRAKISQRTRNHHLHRLGYSWKRARYSPAKALDPNVSAEHAASIEALKKGDWTANIP
ncbi:winged helix-turn-helix domain-containing protein [Deinococcus sp. QL22]|uniref:winged helix-turn-helix domain-containing protein n=1 Tax=Deinococcus sp. QL22 TaxID=2939437 RepID=UPI0035301FEB